ncbi:MAG: NmrA family NAD(P)-binding protein [Cytophagales bacterium]|nr:NmrA family NAD(P)-binding protein [Cytophaga sp.]
MIKKIAVFGATGFLGKPVTRALLAAGYEISSLVRDIDKAREELPENINFVQGNVRYHTDLKNFLKNQDAIYLSLSIGQNEVPDDFHTETDGIREIVNVALECGIKRIALLSSGLQDYQGQNGFNWWAFDVKKEAVNYVRDCGIPFTIFYPSSFMENFMHANKRGKTIVLTGESRFPIYFISVTDYARMVVKSFQILGNEDREYIVQGKECFNMHEAAAIFIKQYQKEKLRIKTRSLGMMKFRGIFSVKCRNNAKLIEALNNYSETFHSEMSWEELGKPEITLRQYAEGL